MNEDGKDSIMDYFEMRLNYLADLEKTNKELEEKVELDRVAVKAAYQSIISLEDVIHTMTREANELRKKANAWDDAKEILSYINDYLNVSKLESIGSGCIFHKQIKSLLENNSTESIKGDNNENT